VETACLQREDEADTVEDGEYLCVDAGTGDVREATTLGSRHHRVVAIAPATREVDRIVGDRNVDITTGRRHDSETQQTADLQRVGAGPPDLSS
jgi:hypothetical protein